MTVKRLIQELKKMPPNAIVAWRDHDQGNGEINGVVGNVSPQDPEDEWYSFQGHRETSRTVGVILSP